MPSYQPVRKMIRALSNFSAEALVSIFQQLETDLGSLCHVTLVCKPFDDVRTEVLWRKATNALFQVDSQQSLAKKFRHPHEYDGKGKINYSHLRGPS
ncbi:hypothetical protein K470DRAFT_254768 [Piedraia hortae CBS 480.64]|uniref:Uncharacterized protein n=1 Tax=Piedraia hortae CBS 480.64 TaxID=1314780 RepID=A0A6A7C9G9_9PEZI|nr:hypothetical protein K470DRAFT_254768 [Piedraia hortae CBS 480.64]